MFAARTKDSSARLYGHLVSAHAPSVCDESIGRCFKAIKRNLTNLIEFGYDINYSESVRVFRDKDGNEQLDLRSYMEKHIYMFSGENIRAVFRAEKFMLSDIIDMFGKDVRFSDESDQQITVTADVNEQAMEQFAKAYTPYIEIIKPVSLRERMIHNLSAGSEKYAN